MENPRLLHVLKMKLGWRFSVTHIPGKKDRIPWAELTALAVLESEYPTDEKVQKAEEGKSAVVVMVSGVILSWEEICDLSWEDDKIRQKISLLQPWSRSGKSGLLCCLGLHRGRTGGGGHWPLVRGTGDGP